MVIMKQFYHVYDMCFWLNSEDTFNVTTERVKRTASFYGDVLKKITFEKAIVKLYSFEGFR